MATSQSTPRRTRTSTGARPTSGASAPGTGATSASRSKQRPPGRAERVLLIPLGAALVARERVVDATAPLTSPTRARRELSRLRSTVSVQLTRYERRGAKERTRLTRQLKKARTRVERELRERREQVLRLLPI
jgi:hypothetical protein